MTIWECSAEHHLMAVGTLPSGRLQRAEQHCSALQGDQIVAHDGVCVLGAVCLSDPSYTHKNDSEGPNMRCTDSLLMLRIAR